MWQLYEDVILTRENMKKGTGLNHLYAPSCNQNESNDHLFFSCKISRVVWGVLGLALGTPNSFWQAMAWLHALLLAKRSSIWCLSLIFAGTFGICETMLLLINIF
jgi:hypothetical protein